MIGGKEVRHLICVITLMLCAACVVVVGQDESGSKSESAAEGTATGVAGGDSGSAAWDEKGGVVTRSATILGRNRLHGDGKQAGSRSFRLGPVRVSFRRDKSFASCHSAVRQG